MKIKRFNRDTVPPKMPSSPMIRVSASGAMSLSSSAVSLLGLDTGDMPVPANLGIEFIQDEDRPKDWYLVNNVSPVALSYRQNKGAVIVQNSVIAKTLIKCIDPGAKSLGMLIGSVPVIHAGEKMWPIITSSHKPKI